VTAPAATVSDFTGHTVAITGGAGDVGRAIARHLGGHGARIALLDVDAARLSTAMTELADEGIETISAACDVTDPDAVEAVVEDLVGRCGTIRYLCNNAGYQGAFTPTHAYPVDDFEQVLRINVTGAFIVLRTFAAHMVDRGGGSIVNTASMAAFSAPPNMIAYATSKAAIIGMTQTASKDLAPHGVRVNAISPALIGPGALWTRQVEQQAAAGSQYFDTDPDVVARRMIEGVPMRRYGDLTEIPGTVAYLLSESASYVTGVNITIAGGLMPGRS
jgi:NAD(P)-dependent dehydrogenase (short-subunit alcohol dehydrogenase family)